MILDLEPIFNNEGMVREFDYELDFSAQELSGFKPFAKPVKVIGKVGNKTGIVELEAVADYELDINCDRCAKPITVPVKTEMKPMMSFYLSAIFALTWMRL